jgi:hypothetical protein
MKKIAALTICSFNYINKALVLIDSYVKLHPEHLFTLVIVDKKRESVFLKSLNINILWVEELLTEDFNKYAFTFDIIEFNTNVKPKAIKYLLEEYEKVIYLDPDIQMFSKIDDVIRELETASILITPHSLTPIIDGCKPDDSDLLRFGAYNLGFIGVSKCEESFSFLDWWSDRCLKLGFYEPQIGLAVDQKWIDLAPSFCPNLRISTNVGLNVAFWNLHERLLIKSENKWFVNNVPLVFFHFSSFNPEYPDVIAFKQTRFKKAERLDFIEIAKEYTSKLNSFNLPEFKDQKYSFDYFDDGVYITPIARRFYSILINELPLNINPFDCYGKFRLLAEKNNLIQIKVKDNHKRETFKDLDSYKKEEKIIIIILKIILILLGPQKYYSLMRYLPHISSIRNQKRLIKW